MMDPRLKKLARTLTEYAIEVQPRQQVAIYGSPLAAPLILELYRRLLQLGAYPYIFMGLEAYAGMDGVAEIFFNEANDDQIEHMQRTEQLVRGEFDGMIVVKSSANRRGLSRVDSSRRARRAKATAPMMETFLRRSAAHELRWCVTMFPTEAQAQEASMSLQQFEDFLLGATFSDQPDPVAEWTQIASRQQRLVEWLHGRSQVSIRGEHVDLAFSIAGRSFINDAGHNNLPGGEVFTGPVEDSMQGWVQFTYPAVYDGRRVDGVTLHFDRGKVTQAEAMSDREFLDQMLSSDDGARFVGEWALGLNPRITEFTGEVLLDEKIGGTFHLALGAGYPETGSQNKSGLHWDMICDLRPGGEVVVDGECIVRDGVCLID